MSDYEPSKVSVILQAIQTGESVIASGFAPDSRVTVSPVEDDVTMHVGSDGEGAFTLSANDAAEITLTLMQTADLNDWLSDLVRRQKQLGTGALRVTIKDLRGRSLHHAPKARIQGDPEAEYGAEVGNREWTLLAPKCKNHTGGNF